MVVFYDFEVDDESDPSLDHARLNGLNGTPATTTPSSSSVASHDPPNHLPHTRPFQEQKPVANAAITAEDDRPNPNLNSFSAALSCYPVVSQLASHLDLNTLHDLSATCRQFRANMLQFRDQLVRQTLRCVHEDSDPGLALADGMRGMRAAWRHSTNLPDKITGGRVGQCARDMVGECRKCGVVVCRNCTARPPLPKTLPGRHRRLCRTCMKAPLRYHTHPGTAADEEESGAEAFTRDAFARGPCACSEAVWLCRGCGNTLRSADETYMRGWTWRTRYSTYLDGMGTGIGTGIEGVECGRKGECLAAKEVEKEIDCDADELANLRREVEEAESQGRRWGGTSYNAQEIEGIGGVVKKKVKKRVKLGMVVKEYEDERERCGDYLGRERKGVNRSCCCWCARVIPSVKDVETGGNHWVKGLKEELKQLTPSSSASSTRSESVEVHDE